MSSKGKIIGTKAESACRAAARRNGFPFAERHVMYGSKDQGDLWLCPGVIVEVKGGHMAWYASDNQVKAWVDEAERERDNAGATHGFLVFQRRGIGEARAELWWAAMSMSTLVELINPPDDFTYHEGVVRMTFASALSLLRSAGWGEPIEA